MAGATVLLVDGDEDDLINVVSRRRKVWLIERRLNLVPAIYKIICPPGDRVKERGPVAEQC